MYYKSGAFRTTMVLLHDIYYLTRMKTIQFKLNRLGLMRIG
jgi:hypothetical protein